MKTSFRRSSRDGITLVQCLVFLAGLLVITNVATKSMFSLMQGTNRNRAVAQDILSAMNAGERWREDIRTASGPVMLKGSSLEIPQAEGGAVVYELVDDRVQRRRADGSQVVELQKDVAGSVMVKESRHGLAVWRWELELKPNGPDSSLKPLFSFLAVEPKQSRVTGIRPAGSEPPSQTTQSTAGKRPATRGS